MSYNTILSCADSHILNLNRLSRMSSDGISSQKTTWTRIFRPDDVGTAVPASWTVSGRSPAHFDTGGSHNIPMLWKPKFCFHCETQVRRHLPPRCGSPSQNLHHGQPSSWSSNLCLHLPLDAQSVSGPCRAIYLAFARTHSGSKK